MDLSIVPILPQRQDSTLDQLRDLYDVANRLGMQDAADVVRNVIEQTDTLSPDAAYLRAIVAHLLDGHLVMGVKVLREKTGMMLADSKHTLDYVCARFNLCSFSLDVEPEYRPKLYDLNDQQTTIHENIINLILRDYSELVKA